MKKKRERLEEDGKGSLCEFCEMRRMSECSERWKKIESVKSSTVLEFERRKEGRKKWKEIRWWKGELEMWWDSSFDLPSFSLINFLLLSYHTWMQLSSHLSPFTCLHTNTSPPLHTFFFPFYLQLTHLSHNTCPFLPHLNTTVLSPDNTSHYLFTN